MNEWIKHSSHQTVVDQRRQVGRVMGLWRERKPETLKPHLGPGIRWVLIFHPKWQGQILKQIFQRCPPLTSSPSRCWVCTGKAVLCRMSSKTWSLCQESGSSLPLMADGEESEWERRRLCPACGRSPSVSWRAAWSWMGKRSSHEAWVSLGS